MVIKTKPLLPSECRRLELWLANNVAKFTIDSSLASDSAAALKYAVDEFDAEVLSVDTIPNLRWIEVSGVLKARQPLDPKSEFFSIVGGWISDWADFAGAWVSWSAAHSDGSKQLFNIHRAATKGHKYKVCCGFPMGKDGIGFDGAEAEPYLCSWGHIKERVGWVENEVSLPSGRKRELIYSGDDIASALTELANLIKVFPGLIRALDFMYWAEFSRYADSVVSSEQEFNLRSSMRGFSKSVQNDLLRISDQLDFVGKVTVDVSTRGSRDLISSVVEGNCEIESSVFRGIALKSLYAEGERDGYHISFQRELRKDAHIVYRVSCRSSKALRSLLQGCPIEFS